METPRIGGRALVAVYTNKAIAPPFDQLDLSLFDWCYGRVLLISSKASLIYVYPTIADQLDHVRFN